MTQKRNRGPDASAGLLAVKLGCCTQPQLTAESGMTAAGKFCGSKLNVGNRWQSTAWDKEFPRSLRCLPLLGPGSVPSRVARTLDDAHQTQGN
mmetsp:Transcript_10204/g.17496  ORF Transcript_10204/g.17496 Transcript_10204/m.17496 type:complete len:93 (+) Transcript_10204:352-630(+)